MATLYYAEHCTESDSDYDLNPWSLLHYCTHFYQPQLSWVKLMFLQASVILSMGGGVFASVHAGIPPPRTRHPPPGPDTPWADTPPDQTPMGPDPRWTTTPWDQTPPRSRHSPPLGLFFFALAYGQRAAGTHPTGMHSCWDRSPYQDWDQSPCPEM